MTRWIPEDVSAAVQALEVREENPRGYYFLPEGGGVTLGDSPQGRFVYGCNGFTLWCQADGYLYASDGLHQLFPVTKEGEEPAIAFFLHTGDAIRSLLPVPFLSQQADRATVFTPHATYYISQEHGIRSTVRVSASPQNELLFSLFLHFDTAQTNCRLLSYFAPQEKTGLGKTDEDRWFLTAKTRPELRAQGNSSQQLFPGTFTVHEDPDRLTSHTHRSELRGSATLAPGMRIEGYETTTSRQEFVGGGNRNLNDAESFHRPHFPRQRGETVFNDRGVFANALFFATAADSGLRLDYIYQRTTGAPRRASGFGKAVRPEYVDRIVNRVARSNMQRLKALHMHGAFDPERSEIRDRDFFPFLINLQQQVTVCSELKGYMQVAPRSLVGIRDVFQALEAYQYFAPAAAREKILEALERTGPNGRCLRQYLPGSEIADTREFIDQGLWVIQTLVEYLKLTGNRDFFFQQAGYHRIVEDNPFIGAIRPASQRDSVLEHLLRILRYLIRHIDPDTKLLKALYGDWNDALDGLGFTRKKGEPYGTGTTVMGSLQLYKNCADMIALLSFLKCGKKHKTEIRRCQTAMRKLYSGLTRNAVLESKGKKRIAHGFGDRAQYTVGGFQDPDGFSRLSLTSHAFWILSGLHQDAKQNDALDLRAAILDAYETLDDKYGLRTFHPAFARGTEQWFGRIPKLPPGTAENGATYNHATLFAVASLFAIGESEKAWAQLEKLLPFTSIHANYNLTPFVIPNSYLHNPELGLDGESMNDWQTGSSNVLLKILIWYVFGFRPEFDRLRIQPDPSSPLQQFQFEGRYQNKAIRIEYEKTAAARERSMQLNGKPLTLLMDDPTRIRVADIPVQKLKRQNRIEVVDPESGG